MLNSFKASASYLRNPSELSKLPDWITKVRQLAKEHARGDITDQVIGGYLAHIPADDAHNLWPIMEVKDIIELLDSDELERGLEIERFNMRGAFSKGIFEGGGQERSFAIENENWAIQSKAWPRTFRMLHRIAENWRNYAEGEDQRARLDKLKA